MHPSMLNTSIIDLLEADPRPSFIVALHPHPPTVVYTNPALSASPALLDLIVGSRHTDDGPLWQWITGRHALPPADAPAAPNGSRAPAPSLAHAGVYWTRSVVHEQMVVVGANEQIPPPEPPHKGPLGVVADPAARDTGRATYPGRFIPGGSSGMKSLLPRPPTPEPLAPRITFTRSANSAPAGLPLRPKEKPPSRTETAQPVGRSTSDPGWILPDTTSGG